MHARIAPRNLALVTFVYCVTTMAGVSFITPSFHNTDGVQRVSVDLCDPEYHKNLEVHSVVLRLMDAGIPSHLFLFYNVMLFICGEVLSDFAGKSVLADLCFSYGEGIL